MHKLVGLAGLLIGLSGSALAETRQIGTINYNWRMLGSDDRIIVNAVDDPKIDGVVCFWSAARKGGIKGAVGLADDPPEASLACRQIGPIRFKAKFGHEENIAKESRNWTSFKTMQVVRMCDRATNTLVYTVYTDELFNGFPHNSISAVPMQPWGTETPPKCTDGLK